VPEYAGQVLCTLTVAAAPTALLIGQAGFSAVDDLVHGFGGGYLPPVVPAPAGRWPHPASRWPPG
jgi:hypothetical protein